MDVDQAEVEAALLAKALKGDIKAITFYLCNRDPDHWKPLSQAGQEISGVRKKIRILTTEEYLETADAGTDTRRSADATATDDLPAP